MNTEVHTALSNKYILILTFINININIFPLDKLSRHLMGLIFFPFKSMEIKLKLKKKMRKKMPAKKAHH